MRRIALLLAAAMLTLVAAPSAQAQTDPYGNIPDVVSLDCVVTEASSETSPGSVACTGQGLLPGSTFEIVITWQAFSDATAASFDAAAAAVAFVGAQGSLTTTMSGTVDANGRADAAGVIPAGADSSKPSVATLAGTAKDGSVAVAADTVNAQATPPTGTDGAGAPTTPATGAESGILALISLALVVAGGGAVLMSRRRTKETVA